MIRRQAFPIPGSPGLSLQFATAEDVILQKLQWYQVSGGVSERQWNDVQGVLKVRRQHLDFGYLEEWAPRIGVEALLRRAYEDAGIDRARA